MVRSLQLLCVLFLMGVVLRPQAASAHPHEFVTMKIKALFDKQGAVAGLEYNWVFDEFFSAYAMEGQDHNKNGKPDQDEVDAVLKEVLGNIGEINYFTKFDRNGVQPEFGAARPVSAAMVKRQLSITFALPFKTPVAVGAKPLRYAIYDDEFYIAMQHAEAGEALKLVGAPEGCAWDLREPKPDEDVAAFAASLDKTQSGGSDLGANFAEWMTISCK